MTSTFVETPSRFPTPPCRKYPPKRATFDFPLVPERSRNRTWGVSGRAIIRAAIISLNVSRLFLLRTRMLYTSLSRLPARNHPRRKSRARATHKYRLRKCDSNSVSRTFPILPVSPTRRSRRQICALFVHPRLTISRKDPMRLRSSLYFLSDETPSL